MRRQEPAGKRPLTRRCEISALPMIPNRLRAAEEFVQKRPGGVRGDFLRSVWPMWRAQTGAGKTKKKKKERKAETVPWPSFTSERENISAGADKTFRAQRGANHCESR